jgi:tetratricopeptide (TPR) repeat protein
MIAKAALCLSLGVALAAQGQSRRENLKKCLSSQADAMIAGCTALIQAGKESSASLEVAYWRRGEAYTRKGDYEHAIQDYGDAIRLNPNDMYAYLERGNAYNLKRDYGHAVQDFNEAIRVDPNSAEAHEDRGVAYIESADYDWAIQDFDETVRLKPSYADAYYDRGAAHFFKSDLKAAIADFEHVISMGPNSISTLPAALMLHVAMKRQGQDDVQELERVAGAVDLSKWPGPLLKLDMGEMTVDEVLSAAANTNADIQKLQVCQANYFIGQNALLHAQPVTARARFTAARDSCQYTGASLELEKLDAPDSFPVR